MLKKEVENDLDFKNQAELVEFLKMIVEGARLDKGMPFQRLLEISKLAWEVRRDIFNKKSS